MGTFTFLETPKNIPAALGLEVPLYRKVKKINSESVETLKRKPLPPLSVEETAVKWVMDVYDY